MASPATVKQGTPVFIFDQAKAEADVELTRTEIALDLFQQSAARLQAISKPTTDAHDAKVREAIGLVKNYEAVLASYRLGQQVGTINQQYLVSQMSFFVASTKLIAANEVLAQFQVQQNLEDTSLVFPGIRRCLEIAAQEALHHRDRMTVLAPKGGRFTPAFSGRRWVGRGSIIGTYDVNTHPHPKIYVEATAHGYIQTLDIVGGTRVRAQQTIATMETGAFDLQAAQIELTNLMLLRTLKHCSPDEMKARFAARLAHRAAMDEKVRSAKDAVEGIGREVQNGIVSKYELDLAEGSLHKANIDYAQVDADDLALKLSIEGLVQTIKAYQNIIKLQRNLTASRQREAVIRAEDDGILTWFVNVGSFVAPGARIASIS